MKKKLTDKQKIKELKMLLKVCKEALQKNIAYATRKDEHVIVKALQLLIDNGY